MKRNLTLLFILFFSVAFAQKNHPEHTDLSSIILYYDNGNQLIGYKGDDGKRLKIVFTQARKSTEDPMVYDVTGKTGFDNKVTAFSGTMTLVSFDGERDKQLYTNEQGQNYYFITGIFICDLNEKETEGGGVFKGVLEFYVGLGKNGKLVEDDQVNVGDAEKNFLFNGTWKDNKTAEIKMVKWGDNQLSSPIGHMGDDGMFYVDIEDPKNELGWETYRKAYQLQEQDTEALKEEQRIWWE